MNRSELKKISDALSKIIERHVKLSGPFVRAESLLSEPTSIRLKIDLLERALEILRIENRYLENKLPMEEFIQISLRANPETIWFRAVA